MLTAEYLLFGRFPLAAKFAILLHLLYCQAHLNLLSCCLPMVRGYNLYVLFIRAAMPSIFKFVVVLPTYLYGVWL